MNSVQKNFHKQMKESLKKMKKENKDMYYNYLRKNHIHDPEIEERENGVLKGVLKFARRSLSAICIFFIIVLGIAFLSSFAENKMEANKKNNNVSTSKGIGSNLSISNQQEIINYLNQVSKIENEIISDLNKRASDINSYNSKTMTSKEYLNNIIVYQNRINDNISQVVEISSPNELTIYKTELQNTYKLILTALQNEVKYFQTNNVNNRNELQKQFRAFDEAFKNKKSLLNSILDKNGIRHN
ncbi:hypothetical protein NBE98_03105 [Clostridium swellfunianum]|uniref:hypothetical protein n=1 Tax=Clostridium swellfunianum TaxID=1367462 RepID=UPI002030DC8E|nr:hypothetical protein [Clostridium swellfunianum]MCM0647363.1 hypothetical protein [Clostridium swellfunianum]